MPFSVAGDAGLLGWLDNVPLRMILSTTSIILPSAAFLVLSWPRIEKRMRKRIDSQVAEVDEEEEQTEEASSLRDLLKKHHKLNQRLQGSKSGQLNQFLQAAEKAEKDNERRTQPAEDLKALLREGLAKAKESLDKGEEHPNVPHVHRWSLSKTAEFTALQGRICRQLRTQWGFEDAYWSSLLAEQGLRGGSTQKSGKSGSLFWFSDDNRFVIKTLEKHEFDKAVMLLPKLLEHSKIQPKSLIVRICGFYHLKVRGEVMLFVIMTNAFAGPKPDVIYDLKGTTEDRWVSPMPGKVLKDLNFADKILGLPSDETVKRLKDIIKSDAELLNSLNIMDYSLLLGVRELGPEEASPAPSTGVSELSCLEGYEPLKGIALVAKIGAKRVVYEMAIIDILQAYNLKKKVAHLVKAMSIGWFRKIDTEPPDVYASRFISYFNVKIQTFVHEDDKIGKFLKEVREVHSLPTSRPLTFPKAESKLTEAIEAAVRQGGQLVLTNQHSGLFRSKFQEVEAFIDVERFAFVFSEVGDKKKKPVSVSLYSILAVFPSIVSRRKESRLCADCGGPAKVMQPSVAERRFTIKASGMPDLRFHAPSRRQMKLWVCAIEAFRNYLKQEIMKGLILKRSEDEFHKLPYGRSFELGMHWEEHFIEKNFRLMDEDHSGNLSLEEVKQIWLDLNINWKGEKDVERAFRDVCGGNKEIDRTRFKSMVYALGRGTEECVQRFFNDALALHPTASSTTELSARALQAFLKEVQGEEVDLKDMEALLEGLVSPYVSGSPPGMTLRGFSTLMCCDDNGLLQVQKDCATAAERRHEINPTDLMRDLSAMPARPSLPTRVSVTDEFRLGSIDMTMPLTEYWLASSHNTYLEGNQLSGRSSALQYVDVLHRGCRCVEIDVWDGPDGDPVVRHGYTATTSVHFQDVVQAIRDHAFSVTPFPLVISIEQKCQKTRQLVRQGKIMEAVFGDALLKPPMNAETGEVLWKDAKVPSPMEARHKIIVKSSVCICKRCRQKLTEYNKCIFMPTMKFVNRNQDLEEFIDMDWTGEEDAQYQHSSGRTECHCTSFTEDGIEKWIAHEMHSQKSTWRLRKWHSRYFSRAYPKGTRVDSSNYDPLGPWSVGVQMVALNYQTPDLSMLLNEALFENHDSFGLAPKSRKARGEPAYRKGDFWTKKLQINLMSGHRLPKAPGSLHQRGECVSSPYVVISLITTAGHEERRSEVVNDNGFDPIFDFEVEFKLGKECDPELCFLIFQVIDRKNGQAMAHAALPVHRLKQGVRWVRLCRPVGGLRLQASGLLVHLRMEKEEI